VNTAILPAGFNQEDLALQIEMLKAGTFHFDHMPKRETWRAAKALVEAGLVDCWETGSDKAQYTAMNFLITAEGRAALKSVESPSSSAGAEGEDDNRPD
jgi:hypothetical protein